MAKPVQSGDLADELKALHRQIVALQIRAATIKQRLAREQPPTRPGWPIRRAPALHSPGAE